MPEIHFCTIRDVHYFKKTNTNNSSKLKIYVYNDDTLNLQCNNFDDLQLDYEKISDIFMSEANDFFMKNLIKFKNLKIFIVSRFDKRLFTYNFPNTIEIIQLHNCKGDYIFPHMLFPNLRGLYLCGNNLHKIILNQPPNLKKLLLDYVYYDSDDSDDSYDSEEFNNLIFTFQCNVHIKFNSHCSLETLFFIYSLFNTYNCNVYVEDLCINEFLEKFSEDTVYKKFEKIVKDYEKISDVELHELVMYHLNEHKSINNNRSKTFYPIIESEDVLFHYLIHLMYLMYRVIYIKHRPVYRSIFNGKINKLYECFKMNVHERIRNCISVIL